MLDATEELTEQYEIDLALHNHPQPSHYWNPDIGLAALQGRSHAVDVIRLERTSLLGDLTKKCCNLGCRSPEKPGADRRGPDKAGRSTMRR
jgi:hypothetical protein